MTIFDSMLKFLTLISLFNIIKSQMVIYRVVVLPKEYKAKYVGVVVDNNKIDKLSSSFDGYYWTGEAKVAKHSFYYVLLDENDKVVASENNGSQIDGSNDEEFAFTRPPITKNTKINHCFGRNYTTPSKDDIVLLPMLVKKNKGIKKFSNLFQEGEVLNVRLVCDPAGVNKLLNDDGDDIDIQVSDCELTIITSTEEHIFKKVSIKLGGQGSRGQSKRPFQVVLNDGDELYNRDKFKLRNIVKDCTGIKNKIVVDIGNAIGLPSTQAGFARFYLNDYAFGLYDLSDVMKKKYIRYNFHKGNKDAKYGILYKGKGFQNVMRAYLMRNPEFYVQMFSIKNFESDYDEDDQMIDSEKCRELIEFIDWIYDVLPNTSIKNIEKSFDIDTFLKTVALEYLVEHRDGFLNTGNNYFIYKTYEDKRYHVWSYDYDNTFKSSPEDTFNEFEKIYNYGKNIAFNSMAEELLDCIYNPLAERIFMHNEFRERFNNIISEIVIKIFNKDVLGKRILFLKDVIRNDLKWDSLVPRIATQYVGLSEATRYTWNEINEAFNPNANGQTCSGKDSNLLTFIDTRYNIVINEFNITTNQIEAIKNKTNSHGYIGSRIDSENAALPKMNFSILTTIFLIFTIYILI